MVFSRTGSLSLFSSSLPLVFPMEVVSGVVCLHAASCRNGLLTMAQHGHDTILAGDQQDGMTLLSWICVPCERQEIMLLIPIICLESRLDHSGQSM